MWSRVTKGSDPDACWEWQGSRFPSGYGQIFLDTQRRNSTTHRAAYELAYGEIPDGVSVLHRCDNPPCCNPKHLYAGNASLNAFDRTDNPEARRMAEKDKEQAQEPVTVTYSEARKRTQPRAFSFHQGDDELVGYIAQYLGTSRSEAVRASVRAFAAHLAYINGSRQGR